MESYTYLCPVCGYEQSIISEVKNERVYCFKCSTNGDGIRTLMDQVSHNKNVNVELLLEDDHK